MKTDLNFKRQYALFYVSAACVGLFGLYSIALFNYWIDGNDVLFFGLLGVLSISGLFNMLSSKDVATTLSVEGDQVCYFDGKHYRVAVPVAEVTEVKVQNLLLCNRLIVDFSGSRRLARFNIDNAEAFRDYLLQAKAGAAVAA